MRELPGGRGGEEARTIGHPDTSTSGSLLLVYRRLPRGDFTQKLTHPARPIPARTNTIANRLDRLRKSLQFPMSPAAALGRKQPLK